MLNTEKEAIERLARSSDIRALLYAIGYCPTCHKLVTHHEHEPFASCECGTGEDCGGPSLIQRLLKRLEEPETVNKLSKEPVTYTVISVSSNSNSFGYKGLIVLNRNGDAFELHCQAYGSDPVPSRGDDVRLNDPRFACPPPRQIESPLKRRVARIIKEAKQERRKN